MRNYLLLWDPFLDTAHFINWYAFIIRNARLSACADHKHVKNTFNAPSLTVPQFFSDLDKNHNSNSSNSENKIGSNEATTIQK